MWDNKNKIIISLLLIGCTALCYAQDATAADEVNKNLDKSIDKLLKVGTTKIVNPLQDTISTKYDDNDDDINKHKNKTTTTTTTTTTQSTSSSSSPTSTSTTTTSTTAIPDTTSTSTSTTTTSTTAIPDTTSTSTSTTTTARPSTTTKTTTTAPTTTTTTPTTTTAKPSPSPTPKPDIGLWNSTCIRLRMAAEVNFNYTTKDNKTTSGHIVVPSDALLHDVDCSEKAEVQHLILEWGSLTAPNSLTVGFEKNNSEYGLYMLLFKIQSSDLPNAKENTSIQLVYQKNTFLTPIKMSYHCTREQKLNLTSTLITNETAGIVSLMNLQFEAFHLGNNTMNKFSTARDCDAIDTPDIVPIAVGIALIALILVVLIGYLVARRRSNARGYMSF